MKFIVMKPAAPVDHGSLTFASVGEMFEKLSQVRPGGGRGLMEAQDERAIVNLVRHEHRDAVAMPVPVKIDATKQVLLGVIANPMRMIDVDEEIPFEMFVYAEAENGGDTFQLKKNPKGVFDRTLWRLKPVRPDMSVVTDVELRATDLEVPTFTDALVGFHDGRLVVYVEVGGIEMSLKFEPGVSITNVR